MYVKPYLNGFLADCTKYCTNLFTLQLIIGLENNECKIAAKDQHNKSSKGDSWVTHLVLLC